jgi:gas vesicle protein
MHFYRYGKVAFMRVGKYETSDKSSAGTAVTFLMIGIGAGALIALLLAPKTGKQMRKEIRRKYDDARDALQDWSEDAKDRVNDVVDRSAEWAEELREVAREKAAPIAKAIKRD